MKPLTLTLTLTRDEANLLRDALDALEYESAPRRWRHSGYVVPDADAENDSPAEAAARATFRACEALAQRLATALSDAAQEAHR